MIESTEAKYTTETLAEFRRAAHLSQDQAAEVLGLTGRKRRDSVAQWELGENPPGIERRIPFILYLWDSLKLRDNPDRFRKIWTAVMVGQWEWRPLDEADLSDAFGDDIPGPLRPRPPPTPVLPVPPPPRPIPTPDVAGFIGRQGEMDRFTMDLEQSGIAVLIGMAGIGKTTLAALLARRRAKPEKIFWHAFRSGEDGLTILRRLAGFLYWHDQQDLWRMVRSAGSPGLAADLQLDYCVQGLEKKGFVLCLDDFQHVDQDPLIARLVEQLRHVAADHALVLILTTRRTPPGLETEDVQPLQGLNSGDTMLFMKMRKPDLDANLIRRLHKRTEGNPQFLTLAANALQRFPDPAQLVEQLDHEPHVKEYLLHKVEMNLSPIEREIMMAVALLDEPASAHAIEAVLAGQRVQPALDDLSERNLLRPVVQLPQWEYEQHAIVQAFYSERPSHAERLVMHGRAAEHYERTEVDPLRAGYHLERVGLGERAARLLTANVWQIINQGRGSRLRQVLERFTAAQLDAQLWATVNIALGQTYAFAREVVPSRARFEQGIEALNALPTSPQVCLLLARACRGIGELLRSSAPQEALDWVGRGLAELASCEPGAAGGESLDAAARREGAALRIEAGFAHIAAADYPAAQEMLRTGLDLLPGGPDPLRAAALINLGVAYCVQGNVAEGTRCYREALDVAQRCGDQWRVVSARHDLGIELEIAGDWPAAAAEYRAALALAEKLGSRTPQTGLTLALGIINMKQGNYGEADRQLRASIEMARGYALKRHLVASLSSLADLRLRKREHEAAALQLAEAETLAGEMAAGDQLAEIHRNWALVSLGRGDLPAARASVERSLEWAHKLELELEEGLTLRVQGQALAAAGQSADAEKVFERSLGLVSGHDPYEAARTKVQWGLVLLCGVEAERGRMLLREATTEFERLGAGRDAAAVHEILRNAET